MTRLALLARVARIHPFATAAFVLAACFALFFMLRIALFTVHFADPANRRAVPEPWMTPRYVAHSWHLPPEDVFAALQVPGDAPRRPTLEDIARLRGVPLQQVMDELQAFLERHAQP